MVALWFGRALPNSLDPVGSKEFGRGGGDIRCLFPGSFDRARGRIA